MMASLEEIEPVEVISNSNAEVPDLLNEEVEFVEDTAPVLLNTTNSMILTTSRQNPIVLPELENGENSLGDVAQILKKREDLERFSLEQQIEGFKVAIGESAWSKELDSLIMQLTDSQAPISVVEGRECLDHILNVYGHNTLLKELMGLPSLSSMPLAGIFMPMVINGMNKLFHAPNVGNLALYINCMFAAIIQQRRHLSADIQENELKSLYQNLSQILSVKAIEKRTNGKANLW